MSQEWGAAKETRIHNYASKEHVRALAARQFDRMPFRKSRAKDTPCSKMQVSTHLPAKHASAVEDTLWQNMKFKCKPENETHGKNAESKT
jgi:hypothetical protein